MHKMKQLMLAGLTACAVTLTGCQSEDEKPQDTLVIDQSRFVEMPETKSRGMLADEGPNITLASPALFKEGELIQLDIAFDESSLGQEPDMETLEVVVKKDWQGMDITEEVQHFIEGNRLFAKSVDMAGQTGEFQFQVSIEDSTGKLTEQIFNIKVNTPDAAE